MGCYRFGFHIHVRNLYKVKGFLSFPTRSCLKTGEPVSNRPMIYNTNIIGSKNNIPKNENIKSKKRFIKILRFCTYLLLIAIIISSLKILSIFIRPMIYILNAVFFVLAN